MPPEAPKMPPKPPQREGNYKSRISRRNNPRSKKGPYKAETPKGNPREPKIGQDRCPQRPPRKKPPR